MNREIAAFLRDVAAGQMGPALAERARTLLRPDRARKARRQAKAAPRVAAKQQARATRNDDTATLRHRAFVLSAGQCEKCEGPVTYEAGVMHHTEGGGGRVERQHIGNVAFICDPCHRFLHSQPRIAKEFRIEIREKRERTGER